MVTQKFKIVTASIVNPADYPIGIIKDTWISEHYKDKNYGGSDSIIIGGESADGALPFPAGGRYYSHIVLEIQMPESRDIGGLDEIIKTELFLTIKYSIFTDEDAIGNIIPFLSSMIIGIVEIPDNFDEGTLLGTAGYCNWDKYILGLDWTRRDGATKSRRGISEEDGTVYDTVQFFSDDMQSTITLDLTDALSLGDKKRFGMFVIEDQIGSAPGDHMKELVVFATKEATQEPIRPRLIITYRDYAPEGFDTADNRLKIVPNPDDRRLPLFSWAGVSADDLVDYKLYYSLSSFALPSLATWMATITDTSADEYLGLIGDLSTMNQTRYFRLIAEDTNNLIDDALISNIVSYIRPQLIEAEADRSVSVGDTVTITLSTNAGTPCKKVYVEWGDTLGYWITKETEFTSVVLTHTYSAKGVFTIKAILESSPPDGNAETGGFWSGLAADGGKTTICAVTVNDTYPRAIMTARPLEVVVDEIVRLNAALSHPIASNETLTYQFYKDGSSLGDWSTNPIKTYTALVGDVSTSPIEFTCKVRNSFPLESALSTIEYVSVISNKPATLAFSRDTVITSRNEGRQTGVDSAMVQGGSQEEDVRYGLSNVVITIDGISSRFNMPTDLEIIKDAVEDYDYVQLRVRDELCGAYVYYAGRMVSYRINKTTKRSVSWSVEFRVNARSLTDLSL